MQSCPTQQWSKGGRKQSKELAKKDRGRPLSNRQNRQISVKPRQFSLSSLIHGDIAGFARLKTL